MGAAVTHVDNDLIILADHIINIAVDNFDAMAGKLIYLERRRGRAVVWGNQCKISSVVGNKYRFLDSMCTTTEYADFLSDSFKTITNWTISERGATQSIFKAFYHWGNIGCARG